MAIRYGCQTYTWQMSYGKYKARLAGILDMIAAAGFGGVEAETCMLGGFYADPGLLREALAARGLGLGALTLALPWRDAVETEAEREEADRLIAYLGRFPGAKLILVQLPGADRSDLRQRQGHAIRCVNAVAQRAEAQGIVCACHPNSPPGSLFRTAEDYAVLFAGLDARYVGYCPDSGHIAAGGMNAANVFREQAALIRHVHFKDIGADGEWRAMGEGVIDHPGLARFLRGIGYDGWVMVEEESAQAEADPDAAAVMNGKYVTETLPK